MQEDQININIINSMNIRQYELPKRRQIDT